MRAQFLAISALMAVGIAQTAFTQSTTATTRPDPAQRHMQMLTNMLTLTSDQQTQAQKLLADAQAEVAKNQAQLKTLRTSLVAAIKNKDTGGIRGITQQIASLRQLDDAARAIAAAEVYAILTPDQKTKVDNGVEMLAGMGGGPGGGPGMGPMMRHGGGPR